MDLRRGSQAAVDRVVEFLSANTKTITTTAEIAQVATISANGDTHVGNLIAQAMEKVGKEGVITVKEGRTIEDEIEITEGMRFDRGFISPYFVTDVKSQKVEFEKPYILLSEKKISLLQDILPSLEAAAQARRPLVIIAEDIDGEALAACILNKLRGQLQVAAVKAPGFGDNRKSILGDLAILTGGTVFTDELDIKLERATVDMLGSTGSISITKEDTIVLNGEGSKDAIQARCEQIRSLVADPTTSDFDRSKLQERLAKLSGGVAVIKVGGASEVEVGEKKDRYDDALNATRAAVEEGILPGGGVALLKASLQLATSSPAAGSASSPVSADAKPISTVNFDQELGVAIIRRALASPARTILTNAGEEASVIVGTLLKTYGAADQFAWGYDAAKGEYVDMIKAGIVDPLKVVRTALVDASGVASLLTTSEVCVVESEEEKGPGGGMGGGGMGGMGGMGGF
jgi:chaperonin GroEL